MLKPVKTLNEFVLKYDKDLERILCKSFKKWFNIEDLDEVKNDVYVHLLDKNFFEKYDANIAQFSTYLYTYLRYFLKSRKVKEDKELVNAAESLNAPVFDEGGATLLDVKDFNHKSLNPSEFVQINDMNKEIQRLMGTKIKNVSVTNPYEEESILYFFWDYMQKPRTLREIENFVQLNIDSIKTNPYDAKKDDVKHKIYSYFKNKKYCYVTENNNLWLNVPGVSKPDLEDLDSSHKKVFQFIEAKTPTLKEFSGLKMNGKKKIEILNNLIELGIVLKKKDATRRYKPYIFTKNNKSILHFNRTKNIAWYLINTIKDMYPELLIFENGRYCINAQENAAYKIYQMMVNGKSNKHIANTYKIKNSVLSSTKRFVLNDIKKMILEQS